MLHWGQCVLCTLHFEVCMCNCAVCSVVQYAVQCGTMCTAVWYNVLCALHTTVYSLPLRWAGHAAQGAVRIMHSVLFRWYNVHCELCKVQGGTMCSAVQLSIIEFPHSGGQAGHGAQGAVPDRFEARREPEINGQAAAYSPQIQIHTNAEEIQILIQIT